MHKYKIEPSQKYKCNHLSSLPKRNVPIMKKFYFLFIAVLFFFISANAQYNKIVAMDGSGDYTTVQAAINAAPTSSSTPWVIFIKNGKYNEKVTIPSNKPNIQLIGESVADVIIYFNDYAGRALPGGGTIG